MNAAAPPAATACEKCGSPNPLGAQFCANCGAPFVASPPPAPPPLPPRPPMPAGGAQAQATLALDQVQAFAAAMNALTAARANITGHQPPALIQFEAVKKSFWITLSIACRYRGEVTLSPAGPRQSAARVAVKIDWGGSSGIVALNIVVLLFTGLLIIPLVLVAFNLWYVSSKWSREIAESVAKAVQSGAPAPGWAQPPSQAWTPPSTPRPQPPAPARQPAPQQGPPELEVVERLRALKGLLDQGALTEAEYAAKRAELIAKL